MCTENRINFVEDEDNLVNFVEPSIGNKLPNVWQHLVNFEIDTVAF